MSVNLEQYKPVTYLVFTTNALRNNIGDGTLEFYKRYESSIFSYLRKSIHTIHKNIDCFSLFCPVIAYELTKRILL